LASVGAASSRELELHDGAVHQLSKDGPHPEREHVHHAHGVVKVRHGYQWDIRNSSETETCQHAILFPSRSNRTNKHPVSQCPRDRNSRCG
jgi:hypothetical protein